MIMRLPFPFGSFDDFYCTISAVFCQPIFQLFSLFSLKFRAVPEELRVCGFIQANAENDNFFVIYRQMAFYVV